MQRNAIMIAPGAWLVVKYTQPPTSEAYLIEFETTDNWENYNETRVMWNGDNYEKRQTIFTKKEIENLKRNPDININWDTAIVDVGK